MTTRKTLFIDKVTTFLLAVLLIALGAGAIWWWSGRTVAGTTPSRTSDTAAAADLLDASWFGWAAAAAGVLLVLVGIRWIAAHLTSASVKRLRLAGSDRSGRLDAIASKVVGAAADAYAQTPGVRSAKGNVIRDRGQLVARIDATIEPDAELGLLAKQADETSSQLAGALDRDDLRCSIQLRVAARGRALPRAR